jgi:hypothetical protein
MGELKPKMAASLRKIRYVFMHDWDPIGVGDIEDWPQDEYDAYVMPVYSILRHRRGEAVLCSYLAQIYENMMGLCLPPEEFRDPAEKFLRIDVSHDEIHH